MVLRYLRILLRKVFVMMVEFIKSPGFQFFINPSTLFFIAGMLVAKYGDYDEPEDALDIFSNASYPLENNLPEYAERYAMNHTVLESYHSWGDPVTALELRIISFLLQNYDNSSQWNLKFVDLPTFPTNETPNNIPRKANVLVTDSEERVPIWAVVNLSSLKVESWIPGKSAVGAGQLSQEEMLIAGEIALTDTRVQERLGSRRMNQVIPDVWDAGFVSGSPNVKLVQVFFYGMQEQDGESLAFPFNFVAHVDMEKNVVRDLQDLPLHFNHKRETNEATTTSSSSSLTTSSFLAMPRPNTVRTELLYRMSGSPRSKIESGFRIAGSEELHR